MEYQRSARREKRDTVSCPFCGEHILAVAKKCKHCGEWLEKDAVRPGSGASERGSVDARAVTKGLKQKELQDTQMKILGFLALLPAWWVGSMANSFWMGLLVWLGLLLLVGWWYYRE